MNFKPGGLKGVGDEKAHACLMVGYVFMEYEHERGRRWLWISCINVFTFCNVGVLIFDQTAELQYHR